LEGNKHERESLEFKLKQLEEDKKKLDEERSQKPVIDP
jgi:hypothetical protein